MAHIPVLFNETLRLMNVRPDGVYLDMTLGGFGHGRAICEKLSGKGIYIGLDLDGEAVERAGKLTSGLKCRCFFVQSDYKDFAAVLREHNISALDGCLMDLGVSSFQIDEAERGFSFMRDGPLDMRMDQSAPLDAYHVINEYSESQLKKILYKYGEEKFAPSIAARIVRARAVSPLTTTSELVEAIRAGVPASYLYRGKNPAAKTFQAVRIEVNGELKSLGETVSAAADALKAGGRMCVISFHSLEDRIVKEVFAEKAKGCICPKELPVCVCHHEPQVKLITHSPAVADADELAANVRSRSAKLRCVEKL